MNRRKFLQVVGATSLAAGPPLVNAQVSGTTPTLYYVDGYHGGVRGHMPAGAWRDILNAMRDLPKWKLCLDIEPASWDVLRRDDPRAYHELKSYLDRQPVDARVEVVNGTFAQPFGWANGGESNIRQIVRGREVILKHFPSVALETFSTQEPCWSSCLPQILKSLGFTGAVLKNPSTAWGGYSAGFDAEVVNWVGPDGTKIPTVPRYACEELMKVYETESVYGTPEFSKKCVEHGIARPAGMCYQDLGWPAKPKVSGSHIQFVTWREYMHTVAAKPEKDWRLSMEDILVTLPWGEKTLQAAAQQVRSAENRLLIAEKAGALAWLEKGTPWPAAQLRDAWDNVLWSQHHDSWITVTTRFGRRAWAFQVGSETLNAEESADAIIADSTAALSSGGPIAGQKPLPAQWMRVINTLGVERREVAEVTLATDRGTRGVRVMDAAGKEIPCQVIATRKYLSKEVSADLSRRRQVFPASGAQDASASINTATVLFRSNTPSLGYASYRIEPVYDSEPAIPKSGATAQNEADGSVTLQNDFYRLKLDPARGGAITSLFAKTLNREICDPSAKQLFNEYRGYFIAQEKWRSSTEESARVSIIENGPLRARVRVAGRVGGCPYQTTITLLEGQRRIDFQARFTFEQETWIGDPWDIKPEDRRSERRRSQNDGRFKLQAFFPTAMKQQAVYKNAAYDVCRSRNTDTFFQKWNEIKHNIILHWVDVVDETENVGLAVFSDHTTAYTHGPEHPLALVMGWGGEGGFWWGKCPLKGTQQISYALLPHNGEWDQAGLSEESSRWNEPLVTQIVEGEPATIPKAHSAVAVSGTGIEVPSLLVDGRHLMIRLFNAAGDDSERTISLHAKPSRVDLVELDGRMIRQLETRPTVDGRFGVKLGLPRFGIRTLRCEFSSKA